MTTALKQNEQAAKFLLFINLLKCQRNFRSLLTAGTNQFTAPLPFIAVAKRVPLHTVIHYDLQPPAI